MALIEAKNLAFSYNGAPVFQNLNFELDEGDFLGIAGPNGSGKSTLLRLISGLLPPASGEALFAGRAVSEIPKAEAAASIAYVPGELYLPYDFSVFEVVLMGRSPRVAWWRNYSEADRAAALDVLRRVGIAALKDRGINSISSGERQLAFIAQALAQAPRILLLDEPTSHLDINYRVGIFSLLAELASEKMAVAAVSHDLAALAAYARKVLLLKKGGAVFFGPAVEGLSPGNIATAYGIADPASLSRLLKS